MNDEEKKLDLNIAYSEVTVGQTYPIYGMLTQIIAETPKLIVMINNNIKGEIVSTNPEHLNIIKNRMFEPGIFITEILSYDEAEQIYNGYVQTIVYGKKKKVYDA